MLKYREMYFEMDKMTVFMMDDNNWKSLTKFEQAKLAEKSRRLNQIMTYRIINQHCETAIPIASVE